MTRDDKSRNLADSLDALASDEPGTSRRSERANQPAQSDRLPEAELVEPSKSDTNNPAGRAAGRIPPSSHRGQANRSNHADLKAMAVPALLAVAALMLVPGLWGLAVLTGLDVWGHARSNVTSVAMAMLAAWLIAASLFFGAWHFRRQARQAKAKPTPRSPQR